MFINEYEVNNITDNPYLNEIYKEAVFIDIETTGLSSIFSDIISITFCFIRMTNIEYIKYFVNISKTSRMPLNI